MSLLNKLDEIKESDYDREKFVNLFGTWQNMQSWKEKLSKNPYDISTIINLAKAKGVQPSDYTSTSDGPLIAQVELDRALSDTTETLARYVERNKNDFYDKLSGEQLLAIAQNTGLYRDKTDEKHNALVDAFNEVRSLEGISKDPQKLSSYIQGKLKDAPNWQKESFAILSGNETYKKICFNFMLLEHKNKLVELITTEDGKSIDKNKIKDAIEKNLEIARNEFKDEDTSYLLMANVLYPQEKKN